jgi:hypothetical protein
VPIVWKYFEAHEIADIETRQLFDDWSGISMLPKLGTSKARTPLGTLNDGWASRRKLRYQPILGMVSLHRVEDCDELSFSGLFTPTLTASSFGSRST